LISQQVGDRHPGHLGQVIDGEAPAQRRASVARRSAVGDMRKSRPHVVTDAPWQAVFESLARPDSTVTMCLWFEAAEELDEKERVS
jgi:hypothetical protein